MTGTVTVEDAGADPLENVLVFSETAGFRHDSIDEGIAAIQALGAANDFAVTATEDSTQFNAANLAQYDAVVFLSTTGDVLSATEQDAFEDYMRAGGGFVGIHAAADTEYTWPWYGQMVGGYFRNHPPGTPTATVNIEDPDEPSTEGLPAAWVRTDEWYNYQSPANPVVGGGGNDYSPRTSGVKVLATVNEATYDEQDGNTTDDDHPIAWCSDFDGGRVWYTGMGHTAESFGTGEGNIRQHILGGLQTVTGAEPSDCGAPRQAAPTADDFEIVTIDDDTESPMEIAVADDGRVFYVERITGELNVYNPANGQVTTAATIPVSSVQENGLMGITLDPDFDTNNHLYVTYTPLPTPNNQTRVSRFTVGANNTIALSSEQVIFTWIAQREQCCHSGGSLAFGPNGDLYISTGDNTNPFASDGYDADRRAARPRVLGRAAHLRQLQQPQRQGPAHPSAAGRDRRAGHRHDLLDPRRATCSPPAPRTRCPRSSRWASATRSGSPSIRTRAGCCSATTGLMPARPTRTAARRAASSTRSSRVRASTAGPTACATTSRTTTTTSPTAPPGRSSIARTRSTTRPTTRASRTSRRRSRPRCGWATPRRTRASRTLGTGGAPTGGPRYDFDPALDNPAKFPEYYDRHWFIGEWNNGWIKTATLDDQGNGTGVFETPFMDTFFRPHEMEFGPDGSLYVIDWGDGFGGNNANSGIYRIDYVAGARRPIARATSNVDSGPTPLTVQFSSAGSIDPDETPLTYAWDFDGNGTTDSTDANPTHTYATAGTFNATLTVTDADGQTGFDTIPITAGNTRPTVTITVPEDGQFAAFGDIVPYEITVTDPEDGPIDCNRVTLSWQLGHDDHAHGLGQQTGCSGTFRTAADSGHGANANIFTSVVATYTDTAQGAANALTGRDDLILQPKPKQAEFFATTGRTGANTGGTPGVQRETTTDAGGGQNIGFTEHGDYVSYTPVNLEELTGIRFRVASGGAGGTIEARLDSPTGPLAGSVAVANTGGWQNWADVTMDLPTPPEGTHELFLVFVNAGVGGGDGLLNLNHFTALGRGAANSASPEVTASAEPMTGDAPLAVQFTGTATDPDAGAGEQLTYLWDFGVAGTTDDTSTQLSPTYTYERPGTYLARFTATDANGASATASVQVEVTSSSECPQNNVRSDEFEGDSLDTNRWQIIRPDDTRPPTVSGGNLNFPIDNGSLYGPGTSARNIIVQPLPSGAVEVTAKISTDPLTQNFQQAGLRVYQDDNNWASIHMISANGVRDFEFIYENNGTPRNEGLDKLNGIPASSPHEYWVKLISDGSNLRAEYSFDGVDFDPVGRVADISGWSAPQVGPVALSDQATTYPVARFDWIRFNPDSSTGGGGGGGGGGAETELFADEFDGTDVGAGWEVVRRDQALTVSGGALRIPAAAGDLYAAGGNAANLVLRDPPASGPWTATAKVNFEGLTQYQQAGIVVYGGDDDYLKLGRIAHTTAGDEKFEYIHEAAGTPDNTAADSTPNIAADFPDDYWVQLRYDGTNVTGWYSTDGSNWTQAGRAWPLPANARIGVFSFGNTATTAAPEAAFDSFRITRPGAPTGPSFDDEFEGSSLDAARWNASIRQNQNAAVSGGQLTITTEPGDIYTGDSTPPPNNFILQDAAHAGQDWTIETKVSGTINGGYGQGGLIAYSNGDNWVKLNPISDAGSPRINRIELRSEVAGAPVGPSGQADPEVPADATNIWVRLTKAGTTYSGEYSFDGQTFTSMGSVTNAMASPSFGLYAFGPQADGQGDTVSFDYFWLNGSDAPDECECVETGGDDFESGALDKTKWNAIVREDESLYEVSAGALRVTTVAGDIYTNSNPAATRNFILQDAPAGDWVIETKVSGDISGGYEQGGLLVYVDDDNYIKYDLISDDGQTVKNRIELRSEVNGAILDPQPQVTGLNADAAWLRLTKTGNSYAGEYSLDGVTWQSIGQPVTNGMAAPKFGLFTLGVNSPGANVVFDYFSVDGSTGCEEPEPENRPPVIQDAAASPSSGFAPLQVAFSVTATDADTDDTLTYAWDFDGDGTTDSTAEDPTHTYTTAGDYVAEVTVTDGEAERSRTVPVSVFGPDDPEARFRVLVFSKTAGFRHDSIDEGHAAIELLGAEQRLPGRPHRGRDRVPRRGPDPLRRGGVPLDHRRRAQRDAAAGVRALHPGRRRLHRHPCRGRHRVRLELVRPPGGRLLPQPSARDAVRLGRRRGRLAPLDASTCRTRWPRVDEWYNYRSPDYQDPNVPDGDYSVRDSGVHVLLTLDEATYGEEDGNDPVADDHPISWCQRYDGGRSWYTGMGHTAASFSEEPYLHHLLGGIETAAGMPGTEGCDPPNEDPAVQASADPRTGTAPLTVASRPTAPTRTATRWRTSGTSATAGRPSARTRTTRTWRPARTRRR